MYFRPYMNCPIEALPQLLYNAAYEVRTFENDVPAEILLTDVIAACVIPVQRSHDVRGLDARTMPTTVNTIGLAPSGIGKGSSFSLFLQAVNTYTNQVQLRAINARNEQAQGATKEKVQEPDGMILQEVSYRGLMEYLHGTNRNTAIQHEDGCSFLQSDLIRKYVDKLTQLWSGDPPLKHKVHRADLFAIGSRCSIAFRIQPKLFYPFLKKTGNASFHQGFWPRAIAACYDPERFQTPVTLMSVPRSGGGLTEFGVRLKELLVAADKRQATGAIDRDVVALDAQASAFMHELKFRLKQWRHAEAGDIGEAVARAWENTLRLAAVFQVVCRGEGEISLEMVERAWIIVEWSLSQHQQIFVEAITPQPKLDKHRLMGPPKIPHHQRRLEEDMQFVLNAIDVHVRYNPNGEALLSEIMLLSGFHDARFMKTIRWLITGSYVEIRGTGDSATIRQARPHSVCALQGPHSCFPSI